MTCTYSESTVCVVWFAARAATVGGALAAVVSLEAETRRRPPESYSAPYYGMRVFNCVVLTSAWTFLSALAYQIHPAFGVGLWTFPLATPMMVMPFQWITTAIHNWRNPV
jgi:hypothetical protein